MVLVLPSLPCKLMKYRSIMIDQIMEIVVHDAAFDLEGSLKLPV